MYLQHLAFAFIAGGLLTYLCVTFLGSTGTFIARRTHSLCNCHLSSGKPSGALRIDMAAIDTGWYYLRVSQEGMLGDPSACPQNSEPHIGTESDSCYTGAHLGFLSSGALFSSHPAPACIKNETAKAITPPPGYALSPMARGNSSSGGVLASDRLIVAARHSDVGLSSSPFASLALHRALL